MTWNIVSNLGGAIYYAISPNNIFCYDKTVSITINLTEEERLIKYKAWNDYLHYENQL
jgi:hypothetical protein